MPVTAKHEWQTVFKLHTAGRIIIYLTHIAFYFTMTHTLDLFSNLSPSSCVQSIT